MKTVFILAALLAVSCGEEIQGRIVNGQEATYGSHPYICSLQQGLLGIFWSHICGSVIYNERTIVTAAHCVDGQSASGLRVVCGLHRQNAEDQYQVTRSISSIRMYPQWNPNGAGYPNDIAVIHLSSPLSFNSHVNKIQFASSGSFVGTSCVLSGWGKTSGSGGAANTLMTVNMVKISNEECAQRWSGVSGADINAGHICFFEDPKSACSGDSGGPVRCDNILTGVTSWGLSSCTGTHPSVYTRISHFYNWIVSNAL